MDSVSLRDGEDILLERARLDGLEDLGPRISPGQSLQASAMNKAVGSASWTASEATGTEAAKTSTSPEETALLGSALRRLGNDGGWNFLPQERTL